VGANWNATTETPRMDKMAAEGVRFADFHASYSVCTASRGALRCIDLNRTGSTRAVNGLRVLPHWR
jgi:hypothetical protein